MLMCLCQVKSGLYNILVMLASTARKEKILSELVNKVIELAHR